MIVVDLRSDAEAIDDPIPGALRVRVPKPPLDAAQIFVMAATLLQLPRQRQMALVCTKGVRANLAHAIMSQAGYSVTNIGGMAHPHTRIMLRRLGYPVDR
jgi:rhodanese-related sulfurtransferase